jgi:hypothetical protein
MGIHNQILFGPVEERFDEKRSDVEFWELCVPVEASVGLRGSEVNRVRHALIRWIETDAASFPLTRFGDRHANPWPGRSVTGIPFPISLHRWSLDHFPGGGDDPFCGRFAMKYVATGDRESARLVRILQTRGGLPVFGAKERPITMMASNSMNSTRRHSQS